MNNMFGNIMNVLNSRVQQQVVNNQAVTNT